LQIITDILNSFLHCKPFNFFSFLYEVFIPGGDKYSAQFVVLFWQLRRHTMLLESGDPIKALRRYMIENNLAGEPELKTIEKKIDEVVEDAMDFAR
jgi:hypothetical protein